MPDRPCNQCGKCCTNPGYMGNLTATGADVKRWMKEEREDILKFVAILGSLDNPYADLWVTADGDEKERCPFVRKDKNKPTYRCTIYETRPEICRQYKPWSAHSICVELPTKI